MAIAGDHPEQGLRVALDLRGVDAHVARYVGDAFTPTSRHAIDLAIDVSTGNAALTVEGLSEKDAAFVKQLGKQMWKQATQAAADMGRGVWPRRIQRWRGPK